MGTSLTDTALDEQLAKTVSQESLPGGDRAAAGSAFMQLYERHERLLLAFVVTRVNPNDADDVLQEIWQKVWRFLPTQFKGGNFRAWLYEIARHYLIDHSRRQKRVAEASEELDQRGDHRQRDADEALGDAERAAALRTCLDKLEHANPQAAELVRERLSGKKHADACQLIRIDPQRGSEIFHKAKGQLQSCVEQALS
ncbi:MAG TPA: RNA polymerase sigma factor [Pirellulales bacterium]|jgi:RNA polymerase sigma-70 factor (ECF subfamily)|nr:RNA polymerase sigma factor [Pirellulales bacterium]